MDRVRELINEIKEYGINNHVPIMSEDTIDKINEIINKNNINSILEIGTAIGYSTICFANNYTDNMATLCTYKIDSEQNHHSLKLSSVILLIHFL